MHCVIRQRYTIFLNCTANKVITSLEEQLVKSSQHKKKHHIFKYPSSSNIYTKIWYSLSRTGEGLVALNK
ncbi:hypothetical protein OIU84_016228 [Salix udensis]|uniref:Uncharacterized protein n=1 Tax=Salix udensis TaxID=889485 RepID=A0AAD6J9F8_9ROSI|nr:hypothetical protein OIU84_016228 [Salix udensis]